MDTPLIVSGSPHMHERTSVRRVMWMVMIALMPALFAGIYFFGINALYLTIYGVVAAVLTEALILFLRKKPLAIADGSAVVTGLLVSFNVHAGVPWWIPVVGSVFAVAIGKHAFGGLGHNIMNPALLGRAFLVASWPLHMTTGWVRKSADTMNGITRNILDTMPEQITEATPLAVAKMLRDPIFHERWGESAVGDIFTYLTDSTQVNLFWGYIGGCIGEVSTAALLLGAAFLLWKHVIEWRIPFYYISTVFILTWIFGGIQGPFTATMTVPVFHILSGGLMLGAFFMATDLVTSPVTKLGRVIFALGCGVLTTTIRLVGGLPEGVSYAILIMNLFVPLIDRYTMPKPFGSR